MCIFNGDSDLKESSGWVEGGGKVGRLSARASARMRPAPSIEINTKLVKKSCAGINMVSSDFRSFTDFNFPIAGKTFPVAGKVTSLSGCQGCRPCENNSTEIVHLNFICSASKMSRRKKNINSSRQKRQKQTFTDTDRKNLAAKKRKKNAYRLKHV